MISAFLSSISSAAGVGREAAYIENPDHKDHAGNYEIHVARFHLCSREDIAKRCATLYATMTATPRRSGHAWDSDIAQHLTFSLPRGARLTAAEEAAAVDAIIAVVCPDSPAAAARHTPLVDGVGPDGKERVEHLHLVVASATTSGAHRLTEQRSAQHCAGEQGLLRLATASAVEAVNRIRRREGRAFLATPDRAVESARARKRAGKGHEFRPLCQTAADALSLNDRVDEAAVFDTLRGLGWKVEKRPGSPRIELTAPGGSRSFFRDLYRLIQDTADALVERREKARKGIAQKHARQTRQTKPSGQNLDVGRSSHEP